MKCYLFPKFLETCNSLQDLNVNETASTTLCANFLKSVDPQANVIEIILKPV